jgi:uncharacterized delta-60 repeat protein
VAQVVSQTDGKLVVAGGFTHFNGVPVGRILRLKLDGSLDETFKAGTGADARIFQVLPTGDGNLLLLGAFRSFNGVARAGAARLNPDGSLDGSFAGVGASNNDTSQVSATLVQADGKILIGGNFTDCGGRYLPGIARLNVDGTVDPGFDPGTGAEGAVQTLSLTPEGKIYAAGLFGVANGVACSSLARLMPGGALDSSFSARLTKLDGSSSDLMRVTSLADGKVLVLGHFRWSNGVSRDYTARLLEDGSTDTTFDPQYLIQGFDAWSGKTLTGTGTMPTCMAVQSDGKILLGGNMTWDGLSNGFIVRVDPTGQMDKTFVPVSIATNAMVLAGRVMQLRLAAGDAFLACGDFREIRDGSFSPPQRNCIARFSKDGVLDGAFLMGSDPWIEDMALQPDGKILIGGWFKRFEIKGIFGPQFPNTNNCLRLGRLNADGTLDTTFSAGTGPSNPVFSVQWLGDNRALIAGTFTNYAGSACFGLAKVVASVVDNRPRMRITLKGAGKIVVSWPMNATAFALEWSQLGVTTGWKPVAPPYVQVGNEYSYTPTSEEGGQMFRLRSP